METATTKILTVTVLGIALVLLNGAMQRKEMKRKIAVLQMEVGELKRTK